MDIEQKLREMFVFRDPGPRFTDSVLSRVGDVPDQPPQESVVRLADARAGRRGRRLLLGALVVVGAAAAMLPFIPGRNVNAPPVGEVVVLALPAGESLAADSAAPMIQSDPSGDGEDPLDCVDPDVLYGLLLRGGTGQSFRITSAVPPELAGFEPPHQLVWLGGTERGSGGITQTAAVWRTSLAPETARAAAVGALTAGGWKPQTGARPFARSVFVSANQPVGETYCREGRPTSVMASVLDGVTYVVLSASRMDSTVGFSSACDQAPRFIATASPLDEHMPVLELPRDPATGKSVVMRGGGSSGSGPKRQSNASFTLKDSIDNVARHFASQMAAQGWRSDTSWSGTGSAGSTWTRQLDDDTLAQGALTVSAFANDRFTAVFRAVTAN